MHNAMITNLFLQLQWCKYGDFRECLIKHAQLNLEHPHVPFRKLKIFVVITK